MTDNFKSLQISTQVYSCPDCNTRTEVTAVQCSSCGLDLRALAAIYNWPRHLVAEGQQALSEDKMTLAVIKLIAAYNDLPSDFALRNELAKLLKESDKWIPEFLALLKQE